MARTYTFVPTSMYLFIRGCSYTSHCAFLPANACLHSQWWPLAVFDPIAEMRHPNQTPPSPASFPSPRTTGPTTTSRTSRSHPPFPYPSRVTRRRRSSWRDWTAWRLFSAIHGRVGYSSLSSLLFIACSLNPHFRSAERDCARFLERDSRRPWMYAAGVLVPGQSASTAGVGCRPYLWCVDAVTFVPGGSI